MGKRWEALRGLFAVALLFLAFVSPVLAHKSPIIEYSYVGHLWEASYTTAPRIPVVGDEILIASSVQHPREEIEGNVTLRYSVYQDDTRWEWYNGKPYSDPSYQRVHEALGEPTGRHEFTTSLVIDRVGSYLVLVDYYEDGQYIGQSVHGLDVEQRTIGPLFLAFSAIVIAGVIIGVRKGVL